MKLTITERGRVAAMLHRRYGGAIPVTTRMIDQVEKRINVIIHTATYDIVMADGTLLSPVELDIIVRGLAENLNKLRRSALE